MISFQNVTKTYYPNSGHKPKTGIKKVSFDIRDGEFVTFCGRSGAGKTTILKIIFAQERPNSGKAIVDEEDISQLKEKSVYRLRQKVGFIFQDYKLLENKTIYENVAYALEIMEAPDEEIEKETIQVLELVGLESKVDCFPKDLSGGEKQRVAIARALIKRPKIILADEPTGNLDPYHSRDIIKMLLKINEMGSTVLLSTHSKDIVNSLSRRVITLENGRIIRDEENGRFVL